MLVIIIYIKILHPTFLLEIMPYAFFHDNKKIFINIIFNACLAFFHMAQPGIRKLFMKGQIVIF